MCGDEVWNDKFSLNLYCSVVKTDHGHQTGPIYFPKTSFVRIDFCLYFLSKHYRNYGGTKYILGKTIILRITYFISKLLVMVTGERANSGDVVEEGPSPAVVFQWKYISPILL